MHIAVVLIVVDGLYLSEHRESVTLLMPKCTWTKLSRSEETAPFLDILEMQGRGHRSMSNTYHVLGHLYRGLAGKGFPFPLLTHPVYLVTTCHQLGNMLHVHLSALYVASDKTVPRGLIDHDEMHYSLHNYTCSTRLVR